VASAGQEIHGAEGFVLRLIRVEPEVLEMEASYSGTAPMPPEHLHPTQAERFEVLEGSVRTVIGGAEKQFAAGEAFEVPAGTPHQMGAEEPTRMRWEVRPALRTAEFFERLYGDGPDSARAMGADFLTEFSDEFRLSAT
jgi:quercetin dioxygenase-like cupin family protein